MCLEIVQGLRNVLLVFDPLLCHVWWVVYRSTDPAYFTSNLVVAFGPQAAAAKQQRLPDFVALGWYAVADYGPTKIPCFINFVIGGSGRDYDGTLDKYRLVPGPRYHARNASETKVCLNNATKARRHRRRSKFSNGS
jgi:hypothetical protein